CRRRSLLGDRGHAGTAGRQPRRALTFAPSLMSSAPTEQLQRPGIRRLRALKRLLGATPRPIELQILGRTLLHAALVGAAAGLIGSVFFAGVEAMQRIGMESLTGYVPLRAAGEGILGESATQNIFRPWL